MVFQHFSLFVAVSVAENVTLGMEAPPRPRDLARRIRAVSESTASPSIRVGWSATCPSGSASGSRSCAASSRTRGS
jgi:ABC-type uncharacterized transport system ATPase subunit